MSNNTGLTTREGVTSGVTPVQETPLRNIGIVGFRKRGVPNVPTLVTSAYEDRLRFGGLDGNFSAYMVRHIFKNSAPAGANVYMSRIMKGSFLAAKGQVRITSGSARASFAQYQAATSILPEVLLLTLGSVTAGMGVYISLPDFASPTKFTRVQITAAGNSGDADTLSAAFSAAGSVGGYTSSWVCQVTEEAPGEIAFTRTVNNVSTTAIQRIATVFGVSLATNATILNVEAGQLGLADPGTWANNNIRVVVYPKGHVSGTPNRFVINIYYLDSFIESFSGATWAELIGNVNNGSYYIKVALATDSPTFTEAQEFFLRGGSNGTAIVEADVYPIDDPINPTGLAAFNKVSVQFIAAPEFNTVTMSAQGADYAATKGRCIYVGVNSFGASDSNVLAYATQLQSNLPSFVAMYSLWVKTSDETGNFVWVPGTGIILGAGFLRVPALTNDYAHIPPAGIDSVFRDCIDISPNFSQDQNRINLYTQQYTTNVARFSPGKGFYLASSRTMSTNPLYHSIHVRILTNKYLDTLDYNYTWLSQKPLTPELRSQGVTSLKNYFQGEYQKGALENSIPFEEACQIISDKTNNPRGQDRKQLNIEVRYIPTECSEAVVISMNRNDSYLSVSENNN